MSAVSASFQVWPKFSSLSFAIRRIHLSHPEILAPRGFIISSLTFVFTNKILFQDPQFHLKGTLHDVKNGVSDVTSLSWNDVKVAIVLTMIERHTVK